MAHACETHLLEAIARPEWSSSSKYPDRTTLFYLYSSKCPWHKLRLPFSALGSLAHFAGACEAIGQQLLLPPLPPEGQQIGLSVDGGV